MTRILMKIILIIIKAVFILLPIKSIKGNIRGHEFHFELPKETLPFRFLLMVLILGFIFIISHK